MPVWWFFMHAISKAITSAAVAAIPCGTDLRQIRMDVDAARINDPVVLAQEFADFTHDCYGPSRARLFMNRPTLSDTQMNDLTWIGSNYFFNTGGSYDTNSICGPGALTAMRSDSVPLPELCWRNDRVAVRQGQQILVSSDQILRLCCNQSHQHRLVGGITQRHVLLRFGFDYVGQEHEAVRQIADFHRSHLDFWQTRQYTYHFIQYVMRKCHLQATLPPSRNDASRHTTRIGQPRYQHIGIEYDAQSRHQRAFRSAATAASISARPSSAGTPA